MRTTSAVITAAVTACLPSIASAQAPGFYLTGFYSQNGFSRVYGVSADGRVAAGYSAGGDGGNLGVNPGFTWTVEGGRNDFLEPGIPTTTLCYAISGDGSTTVGSIGPRAFRYAGPGTYQNLGVLGLDTRSEALGVSGDGSIVVGQSLSQPFSGARAFRWTQQTGMVDLGNTRPGNNAVATGISRDGGTVVGYSGSVVNGVDAFVWTQAGGMQILPQLPGTPTPNSGAHATNGDGSIIVGRSGQTSTPVMWRNGSPQDLGLALGWNTCSPQGVNDDGTVVVSLMTFSATQTAGVWTPARGTETLADYLSFHGVSIPDGWSLRNGTGVSEDGTTFVGWANNEAGEQQGFVATVPSPGAALVVVLCAVARTVWWTRPTWRTSWRTSRMEPDGARTPASPD